MNTDKQDNFETRSRALLRTSADGLDAGARSRLSQARAAAVEAAGQPRGLNSFRFLAPAGAIAAALVMTVVFFGRPGTQPQVNGEPTAAFYDLELLADADAFELSQEADLDFIEWAVLMGEQDTSGG